MSLKRIAIKRCSDSELWDIWFSVHVRCEKSVKLLEWVAKEITHRDLRKVFNIASAPQRG